MIPFSTTTLLGTGFATYTRTDIPTVPGGVIQVSIFTPPAFLTNYLILHVAGPITSTGTAVTSGETPMTVYEPPATTVY